MLVIYSYIKDSAFTRTQVKRDESSKQLSQQFFWKVRTFHYCRKRKPNHAIPTVRHKRVYERDTFFLKKWYIKG